MKAILRNALSILILLSPIPLIEPALSAVSVVGNTDGSLSIATGSPTTTCSTTCIISLDPANSNAWTAAQTFNGDVTLGASSILTFDSGSAITGSLTSHAMAGFQIAGGSSTSLPIFIPSLSDTLAGIGDSSAGYISVFCDIAMTATECGRFDTSGNFTILQGSEQIGTSATNPISVNSDQNSAFLIQGTIAPTLLYTDYPYQDSVETVTVTIAPTAGTPTGLHSEHHQVTFDGCNGCTTLGQLAGHSNQLTIASSFGGGLFTNSNPIPLVSSYNPGALTNTGSIPVQKYVLYDSPSGDYTGQAGTTLSNAEFDGLLVYGPTTIPGTDGTLSLYDFRATIPGASPTQIGSTVNAYGIYLSGSCGTVFSAATLNCFAIYDISSADVQFNASQFILNPQSATFPGWGTAGVGFFWKGATYNDGSSSGTVTNTYINKINADTLTASGTVTYTNVIGWDFEPPACSNAGGGTVSCPNIFAARFGGSVLSGSSSGFELVTGSAGATTPTLAPNEGDLKAGIGAHASGDISVVADNSGTATEMEYWTGTTWFVPGITAGSSAKTGYVCYGASNQIFLESTACISSLEEFKNNIGSITPDEALADVLKFKPFWGTWNQKTRPDADTSILRFFGARQVSGVDHRLGAYENGKVNSIHPLDALWAAAIQKQQKEIDALVAHDKAQDAELLSLKAEIGVLKKLAGARTNFRTRRLAMTLPDSK
jgi:hypothetical protein